MYLVRATLWALVVGVFGQSTTKRPANTITVSSKASSTFGMPSASHVATTVQPCALVSSASASQSAANPTAASFQVDPSLALACLKSVPLDVARDVALLEYIVPFVQSQSTLAYLKNPPTQYLVPGVDILGGLAEMWDMLQNGTYTNQYSFAMDLYYLFVRAHDGHLAYQPALMEVFTFKVPVSLVSVSSDGVALPKVYKKDDILAHKLNPKLAISDITHVNNVSVTSILQQKAALFNYQDPDALYNVLFPSTAGLASHGNTDLFSFIGFSQSVTSEYSFTFSNGTVTKVKTFATSRKNFKGITDGAKLHSAFEIPPPATSVPTNASQPTSTSFVVSPTVSNYPYPVVKHVDDYVAGYFLNGSYSDTAVLVLYSFEHDTRLTNSTLDTLQFQEVVSEFLVACKQAGKTKLVVDLQANGGGTILYGFGLYEMLFPRAPVLDITRIRATQFMEYAGQAVSLQNITAFPVVHVDGSPFTSFAEFYGPQIFNGDKFTTASEYDFADPYFQGQFDGLGNGTRPAGVFSPENVVIVTDGTCGSTCTIFTGMATRQAGVRTIAFGGRPINQPMQAMGGVKGSQVVTWADLLPLAEAVRSEGVGNGSATNDSNVPSLGETPLLPLVDASGPELNYKNAYLDAVDGTPAHFIYEAANCKQFYTVETYSNITALWVAATDIAFYGAKCVKGSSANINDSISKLTLGYNSAVQSNYGQMPGPGQVVTGTRISTSFAPKAHVAHNMVGLLAAVAILVAL